MNIFGVAIFITLFTTFLVKVISELLNLRAAASPLPSEYAALADNATRQKSRDYLAATTRLSLFSAGFDLIALIIFWFSGSFNLLDQTLRSLGFNSIITGMLYIGTLMLVQSIIELPFSLVRTFIVEEKFGFNKTTIGVFLGDLAKTALLSIIIGLPVLAALLWFFESAGNLAWLWAWSGIVLFSLLLQYIAPTWIMPMFNTFKPLLDNELSRAIMQYSAKVQFPLSGIFEIDGSKRSSKANAFFTGFGKRKRIALYDTLIKAHPVPELVAVLAHEIGHFKKKHILINLLMSSANLALLFFLLSLMMHNRQLFDAFFMEETSVYGSLLFFTLLYTPAELMLSVFMHAISRKHEYEADAFAVTTYEQGSALADALLKLSHHNLSNLTPHPLYVFLNYSHPPVVERLQRIKALLASQTQRSTPTL
uniref:CAAX prenyl protease 1, putative n=1 Tax=Chlorobium chlorochromatii (strain CaD3) TaxID=340177 RepID=Q3AS21_CHLCH